MAARKTPRKTTARIAELARIEARKLVSEKWIEAVENPEAQKLTAIDKHRRAIDAAKEENEARGQDALDAHAYRTNPPSGPEFYRFTVEVLGYTALAPQPHDELCEFVTMQVPNPFFNEDGRRYALILVPRDCFKSTIIAIALPLYLLVKNPNLRFLISAYRHDLSTMRLRAIKGHIEHNKKFRVLFGDWKPKFREDIWNETSINIAPRTASDFIAIDPTIDTCGVDRPKVGSHPDVIIIDDAHNRDNVQTVNVRRKVYDHIVGMTPMLQPGGTLFIVGTRWSHHDSYGKIIREDEELVRQAARDGKPNPEKAAVYKKLIRGAKDLLGNLYFPSRLTDKYLEDARRQPGMTEYLYQSQYFNVTVESKDNLFPTLEDRVYALEYFNDPYSRNGIVRFLDQRGSSDVPVLTTLAWDTAGHSPTAESDYHGLTVVGCDIDRNWIVLNGTAIKDTPNQVVKGVAALIIMYRPHTLSIEVVGQSGVWITLLRNFLYQNNLYMPYIVENRPPNNRSKLDRIDTVLEPLFTAGRLLIADSCLDLLNQMSEYPQVDHFDVMDSLAQHETIVRPAEPRSDDWLLDDLEDDMPSTISNSRRKLGAWAGRSSLPRRTLA